MKSEVNNDPKKKSLLQVADPVPGRIPLAEASEKPSEPGTEKNNFHKENLIRLFHKRGEFIYARPDDIVGAPFGGEYGYGKGDELWRLFQGNVMDFINSNGGKTKVLKNYSQRIDWRFVYYRYKNELERIFGPGAGSAEKSSFFTW